MERQVQVELVVHQEHHLYGKEIGVQVQIIVKMMLFIIMVVHILL